MARTLGSFSITREADGFVLHMEDDDGETIEYGATDEQLDEISVAIEDVLELEDDDPIGLDEDEEDVTDDE